MAEAVIIAGFVGLGIDNVVSQILHLIGVAVRYKQELGSLQRLLTDIPPIIQQIQRYRPALNRKNGIPNSQCYQRASAVSIWLNKLDLLLRQASELVHQCTLPRYQFISRYLPRRKISSLVSKIDGLLRLSPLVELAQIPELLEEQTQVLMEGLGQIMKESVEAVASSSSSSATTSQSLASTGFFIPETLIVGQERTFAALEKLVIDPELSRVGVAGKGGSGKTLLLKAVFNSEKVRNVFSDGLTLWLTVSQFPSFKSLREELCQQIAIQTNAQELVNSMNPEGLKIWMNQTLQAKKFALFLDDLWGEGAKLLEELGVPSLNDPSHSKIVVSSRDHRALREMGVNAERATISMEELIEDESWRLFGHHAFPYNNGKRPTSIEERTARAVCARCKGLPLAIKAVGRAMAGITDPREWELAVRGLSSTNSQDLRQTLYDPLRWSYDALARYDVNLQLCFLYLSAFLEDQVIWVSRVIRLLIGEGLLARKNGQDERSHDPFVAGRIYINFLADRCLIEPTLRDVDGSVVYFRVHDVLRDLAIQIAEREENFYCRVGKGLAALPENECSGRTRFLLDSNDLSSFPESFRPPEISSLLMSGNADLREIPRKVIGSMVSLKVLDLSGTSLQSLPDSVGCLKQLVSLLLAGVPITRLPASVTELACLEVLAVGGSKITELPSDIHRLRSLRYLGLHNCKDLECLPRSLSRLTSLQYLRMGGCSRLWTNCGQKKSRKKVALVNDLHTLTQLRRLHLGSNGEMISEGTLGSMEQMEELRLACSMMESLPADLIKMSKLRKVRLQCPRVVKMETEFYEFQSLSTLSLVGCEMLEELPGLQTMGSLRKLEIVNCYKLKRFSDKFGEKGAFPLLEIFSLVELKELEELPMIEEGGMPSLKIFTIMLCEALKILPENYLNITNFLKLRLWGCPLVLENLEKTKKLNTYVKEASMSLEEVTNILAKTEFLRKKNMAFWYNEFWRNELYLYLNEITTFV